MHQEQFTNSNLRASLKIIRNLESYGVSVIPEAVKYESIVQLQNECQSLLDSKTTGIERLDYGIGKAIRVYLNSLDKLGASSVQTVFNNKRLFRIAQSFFKGQAFSFNHDVYIVQDIPGIKHFAQPYHYDRRPHLKYFLYVTEVSSQNAPLTLVPKSQFYARNQQASNREKGIIPQEQETRVDLNKLALSTVEIIGPPGTMIIFDSDLIHHAGKITEGERIVIRSRSLLNKYFPS